MTVCQAAPPVTPLGSRDPAVTDVHWGATVAPTETPVDGSGGNAPVANEAGSASPLAEGPATALGSFAPSPETTL